MPRLPYDEVASVTLRPEESCVVEEMMAMVGVTSRSDLLRLTARYYATAHLDMRLPIDIFAVSGNRGRRPARSAEEISAEAPPAAASSPAPADVAEE